MKDRFNQEVGWLAFPYVIGMLVGAALVATILFAFFITWVVWIVLTIKVAVAFGWL